MSGLRRTIQKLGGWEHAGALGRERTLYWRLFPLLAQGPPAPSTFEDGVLTEEGDRKREAQVMGEDGSCLECGPQQPERHSTPPWGPGAGSGGGRGGGWWSAGANGSHIHTPVLPPFPFPRHSRPWGVSGGLAVPEAGSRVRGNLPQEALPDSLQQPHTRLLKCQDSAHCGPVAHRHVRPGFQGRGGRGSPAAPGPGLSYWTAPVPARAVFYNLCPRGIYFTVTQKVKCYPKKVWGGGKHAG